MNYLEKAKEIVQNLQKEGYPTYFVGGYVRDLNLGVPPHDIDIATLAHPGVVHGLFHNVLNTGIDHGTVTVLTEGEGFEVTTFRIDGLYSDFRHPDEIKFVGTIEEDLSRRDFTINAMAYDPVSETLIDPYLGKEDLSQKVIRCVGNPLDRFTEDPLRVLRAMRFAIKLGFSIEKETANAMHQPEVLKSLSENISKERITAELKNMLTYGKPVTPVFLEFSDVICSILPQMKECIGLYQNNWHKHNVYEHILSVVDECENQFEIKLAALLHDIGKPECLTTDEQGRNHFYGHPQVSKKIAEEIFENNLRITRKEKDIILTLIEIHDIYINPDKKYIRKMLQKYGEEICKAWIILKRADLSDHCCPVGKEQLRQNTDKRFQDFQIYFQEILTSQEPLRIKDLNINGMDVRTILDCKSGPVVGKVLSFLLEAVMDKEVENEKEKLSAFLLLNKDTILGENLEEERE